MKQKFSVMGMSCAACVGHVNKAVARLKGVNNVDVNLLSNSMVVDYDEKVVNINDIINAVSNAGYGAKIYEKVNNNAALKKDLHKLIIAFILLIVLMYVSMGHMVGLPLPPFLTGHSNALWYALTQLIITIPVLIIYRKYFISGYKKLFKLAPNMDSLIAISATASMVYGLFAIIMISIGLSDSNMELVSEYLHNLYFESAAMILTLVSFGKYLEQLSKRKTTQAISKLMDLAPKKALILKGDKEVEVPVEEVKVDDLVVVKKGFAVPVDGVIVEGNAAIDEANITGESMPAQKGVNQVVYTSTTINSGYIIIKATKVGEDTSIANIIKLVEASSNSKAPISQLADKIASIFVPIVMAISLLSFIISIIVSKDFNLSFNFAISVLVIACPCSLGLATPVAIMVGTGVGASNGLLIKNAEILEKSHLIKTIVFDKTGTLTNGKPTVTDFINMDSDNDLLSIIYSMENRSEHPLASAITNYANESGVKIIDITNFKAIEGQGIEAKFNKDTYYIGNASNIKIDEQSQNKLEQLSKEGKTSLVVTKNKKLVAIIALKDEIKKNSVLAIHELQKMGIRTVMLTGDNKITAQTIADEVGISEVIAEVLPIDKQNVIKSLKHDNKHLVAMVGDGVNDALALTTADLGISLKGGSDIALETSDIVLLRNDLLDVVNVINLSKRVLNTIKGNLFWAFFYNSIGIVLASGLLYPLWQIKLNPMIGSLAMSLSSVFVVLNALTINLFKPKKYIENNVKEKEKMKETVLQVKGMMCEHCKKHVEDALLKVPGVERVEVSLKENSAKVYSNQEIDRNELINAVKDAGYEAK